MEAKSEHSEFARTCLFTGGLILGILGSMWYNASESTARREHYQLEHVAACELLLKTYPHVKTLYEAQMIDGYISLTELLALKDLALYHEQP